MTQIEYDKTLNDSKWHIVYGTIMNDTHLGNEIEWHLCNILNDTSCMNTMNFEWYNVEWNLNDIGITQCWMSNWVWNDTVLNDLMKFEWFNGTWMIHWGLNTWTLFEW